MQDEPVTGTVTYYGDILKKLFDELHNFLASELPKVMKGDSEESSSDLLMPMDSKTRLCYFAIPNSLISLYRTHLFPIVEKIGYTPITAQDMTPFSENIVMIISSLVERAALIIVDASSVEYEYSYEISVATEKQIPFIIVIERGTVFPSFVRKLGLRYIERSSDVNTESIKSFVSEVEKQIRKLYPVMAKNLYSEPSRLLEKSEYSAAVISVFSLLEMKLKEKLRQGTKEYDIPMAIPLSKTLELSAKNQIISRSTYDKLLMYLTYRNQLVHGGTLTDRILAGKIVNYVMKVINSITGSEDKGTKKSARFGQLK